MKKDDKRQGGLKEVGDQEIVMRMKRENEGKEREGRKGGKKIMETVKKVRMK